jgi:uncharacterized membrane protein
MDLLLILFCILVFTFLIAVAAIYLLRPEALFFNGDPTNDIDMWRAFNLSLLLAILAVIAFSYYIYHTTANRCI